DLLAQFLLGDNAVGMGQQVNQSLEHFAAQLADTPGAGQLRTLRIEGPLTEDVPHGKPLHRVSTGRHFVGVQSETTIKAGASPMPWHVPAVRLPSSAVSMSICLQYSTGGRPAKYQHDASKMPASCQDYCALLGYSPQYTDRGRRAHRPQRRRRWPRNSTSK